MGSGAEADHNFSGTFEGDVVGEGVEDVDLIRDVLLIHVFGVAWGGIEVGSADDMEGVLLATDKKAKFTAMIKKPSDANPAPVGGKERADADGICAEHDAADPFNGSPEEARRFPGRQAHAAIDEGFAIDPFDELAGDGVVFLGVAGVVFEAGAQGTDHEFGVVGFGGESIPPGDARPDAARPQGS